MQLTIALLLALLYTTCLGLGDEWANLIKKGRDRTARIAAATSDTTRGDDLPQWYVDKEAPDAKLDELHGHVPDISKAGKLGLSDKVTDRYTLYPESARDDEGKTEASYQLYLDPKAGAIIAANRVKKSGTEIDRSSADVAWSLYKELCTKQKVSSTNLRTILSTQITADFAEPLFSELWNAQGVDRSKPLVFANLHSDEALAIMGLDTGSMVDGLLEYHNVAMGGKQMVSVSLFPDHEGEFNVWWTLR